VSILPIKEARDAAKAEEVAKADRLLASIESAKLRSENARIEKMRSATAESIANDIRETLALSGINLASVAKLIYDTPETWDEFVHAVEFVATVETLAMATETSIEAITQETC
jgi:type IV pilus biogenesis protein CpaD/CtpE